GHGGTQPELTHVLTCFAGRGVARRGDLGRMDGQSLGPALALLVGLPFPRHMRAGDDDLDVLFDIADGGVLSADYLEDRRTALTRFRTSNAIELAKWLGDGVPATWTSLYARERTAQTTRLMAGSVVLVFAFAIIFWRRRLGFKGAIEFLVWA